MSTETFRDRVIAVAVDHKDEVDLRLADWTPNGGYTSLIDAADRAGLDLTGYRDGETVGFAELDQDGNVEEFMAKGKGCDVDHTDGANLGSHFTYDPEKHGNPWPVIFEDGENGYRTTAQCKECGQTVFVYYRKSKITEFDGDGDGDEEATIWERED